jgi:hypothetical protein
VVVLTVVEGDPQNVVFGATGTKTKTYGDAPLRTQQQTRAAVVVQ